MDLGGKSWAFPKFYDMYKFEELIREFGSVPIASASYGERSHKDFKAAKLFTNNHKATLMSQVCTLHGSHQLHPGAIVDTFRKPGVSCKAASSQVLLKHCVSPLTTMADPTACY